MLIELSDPMVSGSMDPVLVERAFFAISTRSKRELLVKFDPRDVSRIFVQHPDGHFMEARARSLGFPAISLREWKQARKVLGVKGREERNDEQIT